MKHSHTTALAVCLAACSLLVAGVATADQPPRPGSDDSPLSENETATLWSNTSNTCISNEKYEKQYGEERTVVHELGNCTDVTFKEPPGTAATWTEYDFENVESGDEDESVYPEHAETTDSGVIADAHVTIFAAQPSTWAHLSPNESRLYVAPDGELRALVDYRVRSPTDDDENANQTIESSVVDHEVSEVRVKRDGEAVARHSGSQTPVVDYDLGEAGEATVTVEADIRVVVQQNETATVDQNETEQVTNESHEVTVSQSVPVHVYDPTATVYHAQFPDGDEGAAIYLDAPWQGAVLTADGDASVRGVWRYYTARDTDWDRLVKSTAEDTETVDTTARPVYVHAYPAKIGPRAEPAGEGPTIQEVWGDASESPASTMHENLDIGVVEGRYTRSWGLALRHDTIDRESIQLREIVRGVDGSIEEPDESYQRAVSESDLTLRVVERNETHATLRVELRDGKTGQPIMLRPGGSDGPRFEPIGHTERKGYITLDGQRIRTNSSGVATVTVRETGVYSATYHPGSWRTHDPAYVSDSASANWHPLLTLSGGLSLLTTALWWAIPFVVALYAGRRLADFIRISEEP